MITNELQSKIIDSMLQQRGNFEGSDTKYAISLGINAAQYSRIKRGDTDKVLSDAAWAGLARRLGVMLSNAPEWRTAKTGVYQYVTTQLADCQAASKCGMICDLSDIGKTHAALCYAKSHKNVVYIDGSQNKSRRQLIKSIAKAFGVSCTGTYSDVYEDLKYYLRTIERPMIIIDEAGDISSEALLEIKALENGTKDICAIYLIGAEGLETRIRRGIDRKSEGYMELFTRFGRQYEKAIEEGGEAKKRLLEETALLIIKANIDDQSKARVLLHNTKGADGLPSLRRIKKSIEFSRL